MRRRDVLTSTVLMPVVAAVAAGQEGRPDPSRPVADRARLRGEVIALRAELELLNLEHEADRAALLDLMKTSWQVECAELLVGMTKAGTTLGVRDEPDDLPLLKVAVDKKGVEALRGLTKRTRAEFVRKTRALHEKRMDLADIEARYAVMK